RRLYDGESRRNLGVCTTACSEETRSKRPACLIGISKSVREAYWPWRRRTRRDESNDEAYCVYERCARHADLCGAETVDRGRMDAADRVRRCVDLVRAGGGRVASSRDPARG